MTILKRLPIGFLFILGATLIIFSAAIWCQWDNLKNIHAERQISTVNRFASSVDSLLSTQEMVLSFLQQTIINGQELIDNDIIAAKFDHIIESNRDIAMLSISNLKGEPQLVRPHIKIDPRFNLLDYNETRDSFLNALNSGHMVLGRTYRLDGQLIIPLRKTLRSESGEPVAMITVGLRVNDARLFNNHQHYAAYNTLTMLRDDGYRQFISSHFDYPSAYTNKPFVFSELMEKSVPLVDVIASQYPYKKESFEPYLFYNERAQVVIARLDTYGLWIKSRILQSDIITLLITPFLIQFSLFIFINLAALYIIRLLAAKQRQRDNDFFYQAHHDELTTLPNRQYFTKHMNDWFKSSQKPFAMILINVDHFKLINDRYGYLSGDRVLQEVTTRLKKLECTNELLIRYAGDEFILLTSVTHTSELHRKASIIIKAIALPFKIGESELRLGCSLGIAKAPEHGKTLTLLLRSANIAMYNSKKEGNTFNVFTFSMAQTYMGRLEIEERLRVAAELECFYMVYQPQVDANNTLYGVEALVRWEDEKLGFVPPDKFIAIAEYCGLMPKIGNYIIETTLKEMSALQKSLNLTFQIAINISAQQFSHIDFITMLKQSINRHNIDPKRITIEITESLFIDDINKVLPILNQLRDEGICISLDDFGTGYSSLNLLRTLPIDELKIDKSFVDDIMHDVQSLKMVQNIISIGKNLNLTLLAEGIETVEQKQCLIEYGCDLFQGFHYSKPLLLVDLYEYTSESKEVSNQLSYNSQ